MLSHLTLASSFILRVLNPTGRVKIGIRIESFAIIKYVVYPQTITYIVYCHAKLQLEVILGSLWGRCGSLWGRCGVVVGRCGVVVDRCGVVVGRCGSLWVVVDRCGVIVGRCGVVVGRCGSLWVVPCFSNYVTYIYKQQVTSLPNRRLAGVRYRTNVPVD
jgi:hypothetical protein